MLDARPAPDALARPPLPATAIDPPASPARPSAGDALFAAAQTLLPVLEAGKPLDAATLRDAMTEAFGTSDASGGWVWKDAYEAAEAACVLFLQRYGRDMRRTCGAGVDGPRRMLAMLEAVAALEPSHTRRSEEQVRLQQFSTPLPLAYAALQAAAIRPGDVVLEPSAGTGMLAVMAQCALGNSGHRQSPSQRIRSRQGAVADEAVSPGRRHRVQRRNHRGPAARRPADRGADEPAVLGDARRRPHHPRRRPPPCPLGRLDAAAGRPAGDDHIGPLRAWRRRRPSRPAGPLRLHHGHRRPRLCPPRHRASTPASPCWNAAPDPGGRGRNGTRRRTPPSCSMPLSRRCRSGNRSRPPPVPGRPRPRPVRQAGRAEAGEAGSKPAIDARDPAGP